MSWLPEFSMFILTLIGVIVLHRHALAVSLTGLVLLLAYKIGVTGFEWLPHFRHEAPELINLMGLLLGFSVLAKVFEESHLAGHVPKWLPNGMFGGVVLLAIVMVISSFLDNIAAALIGGNIALAVFRGKVHPGYLVAIVAASNAGGAGSVVGDTTTTIMWIDGVPALSVVHAFVGSIAAFAFFGTIGAWQQHKHQPVHLHPEDPHPVDWVRIALVALMLAGAVLANLALNLPAVGVWVALLIGMLFRPMPWSEVPPAAKGSFFLVALVFAATLLPVSNLPEATWISAMLLGVSSAFFGALPLTKLALEQGGYDWGFLAFAVGYGGSMIWFGSGAGVALSGVFPEIKSARLWVRQGWHVPVGYIAGCLALILVMGWHPTSHDQAGKHKKEQHLASGIPDKK